MIFFDFYGFVVKLVSKNGELIKLMEKNFSLFLCAQKKEKLLIEGIVQKELDGIIPTGMIASKQSINSVTFDNDNIRYNNYYGRAISILNYKTNQSSVYAKEVNDLHEIIYLLIMSRQGKWCDKSGIHKIHAMSVSDIEKNLILMLPMKGGKSTLFAKFLEKTEYSLVSDDSPVIDSKGNLLNFPIRFGLEDRPHYKGLLENIDQQYLFHLEREQYGKKILVDFKAFQQRVTEPCKKNILIQGFRINSQSCQIQKISRLEMFRYLFVNMVVGVGLPMIIEYFIENTLKDHVGNLLIFFKRLKASVSLLLKSECYVSYMGYDIDNNFKTIKSLLKE
jgi:hypothetical protein